MSHSSPPAGTSLTGEPGPCEDRAATRTAAARAGRAGACPETGHDEHSRFRVDQSSSVPVVPRTADPPRLDPPVGRLGLPGSVNGDEHVLNHVLDRAPIAKAACDEASHDREAFEQQLFAGLDPCASPGVVAPPVSPAGPIWMSQRGTGRPSAAGRLPPAAASRIQRPNSRHQCTPRCTSWVSGGVRAARGAWSA